MRSANAPPRTNAVGCGDVRAGVTVTLQMGDLDPQSAVGLGHAGASLQAVGQAEVEALTGTQELERQDDLDVGQDLARLAGRDGAHRDMVFLVCAGRDRVGRGRVDEDLVLGNERCRRVLEQHHAAVEAGVRDEERRQPRQPAVDKQRGATLADRAQLGDGELAEVHGQGHRLAVEVAARHDVPAGGGDGVGVGDGAVGKDERVVGCAVDLDLEHATGVGQRVERRAVHLGHAAHGIGILDLVRLAMVRVLQLRAAQTGSAARRRLAPGLGGGGRRDRPRRTPHRCPIGPPCSSPRPRRRWHTAAPHRGRRAPRPRSSSASR